MSDQIRGDCIIQIQKGKIKTNILEQDYEDKGYKDAGWTVITKDWIKDRKVREKINAKKEMEVANLGKDIYKKR